MEEVKNIQKTTKKAWSIAVFMHRLFRVIAAPLMILTLIQIVFCCIISIPLWILTGKTIIVWSCDLMTKHETYVFDGALHIQNIVSSCIDKDELISDLDDRRAVGVEMNEDMWYFCRKQSAEYLLDKYKILRK